MRSDVPPAVPTTTSVPVSDPRRVSAGRDSWTLEMPFTAPLSLNDRMHWAHKYRATKPWRDAAKVLARAARIPACERVRIELHYVPRDDRARDSLNLVATLKPIEDGIVDAGVIPDDSNRHHESVMPAIHEKGPTRPNGNRLWVVVTRIA